MIKSRYNVIGVMSGTSLDGIDLAHITFEFNDGWTYKINNAETVPYTDSWKTILTNLVNQDQNELKSIDTNYTMYLSNVINDFITKIKLRNIDAICSHGHTALHQPENGLTYQIGNLKQIAELTQQKVVCNFRVQDVKLGGQGAPLVPIGDQVLFSKYEYCLNLGGFANISFKKNKNRIAFDICPVNIVLNYYSEKIGLEYDANGKIAAMGKVNHSLLKALNAIEFYQLDFPKSLGLEWVNSNVIPIIDHYQLEIKDVLRTVVEHIVIQIVLVIKQNSKSSVLISGGGVYNTFLIDRLKDLCQNEIIIPSEDLIEYKEALIFGLLGVLKLRDETNCLATVTGATHNHSSGVIHTFNI
ncbi:anhydro-N-acetylmuramic acid kinase [Psychroserpens ponticola]|uniref:Anhydro-N-acetylmuramic acid kinase n=1 Tax=Psychroserpens ponticola TaxID=2932268 RepID=A0ABY7RWF4_9FLAO|nr:anhydro-N-acetylmuramic acid kinase [Psychroserpens ponticola]WCO01025.1 anhydro-N-acetylmuramic acid kinase [Psychroserpens ponticola]